MFHYISRAKTSLTAISKSPAKTQFKGITMRLILSVIFSIIVVAVTTSTSAVAQTFCNESVFKPCICASTSDPRIKFRSSLKACNGRAAVILEGKYKGAFSVVLRDRLNRDRVIPDGFKHNCTSYEINTLGLNKCSAYKAQKTIRKGSSTTFCFGLPGSKMKKATRITIKLIDDPNGTNDVLIRQCLPLFSAEYDMN